MSGVKARTTSFSQLPFQPKAATHLLHLYYRTGTQDGTHSPTATDADGRLQGSSQIPTTSFSQLPIQPKAATHLMHLYCRTGTQDGTHSPTATDADGRLQESSQIQHTQLHITCRLGTHVFTHTITCYLLLVLLFISLYRFRNNPATTPNGGCIDLSQEATQLDDKPADMLKPADSTYADDKFPAEVQQPPIQAEGTKPVQMPDIQMLNCRPAELKDKGMQRLIQQLATQAVKPHPANATEAAQPPKCCLRTNLMMELLTPTAAATAPSKLLRGIDGYRCNVTVQNCQLNPTVATNMFCVTVHAHKIAVTDVITTCTVLFWEKQIQLYIVYCFHCHFLILPQVWGTANVSIFLVIQCVSEQVFFF